jgi:hypothetical protein
MVKVKISGVYLRGKSVVFVRRKNLNRVGALCPPSHFLFFSFLYISNYITFLFLFFASHSKITNRMGENSWDKILK